MENLKPGSPELYQFTHLIAEAKSKFSSNLKPYTATHDVIDSIEAFHQLSFNYLTIPPIKIRTKPVLFILKRRDNYEEMLQMKVFRFEKDNLDDSNELEEEESSKNLEEYNELENKIDSEHVESEEEHPKLNTFINNIDSTMTETENLEEVTAKKDDTEIYKPTMPKIDVSEDSDEIEEKSLKKIKKLEKKAASDEIRIGKKEKSFTKIKNIPKTEINDNESVNKEKFLKKFGPVEYDENSINIKDKINKKQKTIYRHDNDEIIEDKFIKAKLPREMKTTVKPEIPEDRQMVKKNIRKLVQKYKKDKIDNQLTIPGSGHNTKEIIKKIIDEERTKQIEEVNKIQQQIVNIIENNPNIINKDVIKERIQKTFDDELIKEIKPKKFNDLRDRRKIKSDEGKFTVIKEKLKDSPKLIIIKPIKDEVNTTAVDLYEDELDSIEETQQNEAKDNTEEIDRHESEDSNDNVETEEINIEIGMEKVSQLMMAEKFKEASEKIADIMTIIDEIVDTIEIESQEDYDDNVY